MTSYSRGTTAHRRVAFTAVAAVAAIGILSSCSSGVQGDAQALAASIQEAVRAGESAAATVTDRAAGDAPTSAETTTSAEATATAETSEEPPAPVTRTVDQTGWYAGFATTVTEVTAQQGFGDSVELEIDITYSNLGTESNSPPNATIEVDGKVVEGFFDTPGIPGGGRADGTVIVVVPTEDGETQTLDDAIDTVRLVYGDAADNQTIIPLAAGADVDSVEPQDLAAAGSFSQGDIIVEVVSGSVMPSYESGEKGKSLVNLRITVTCAPGCPASGYNVDRGEFSLTAPDGTAVVADQRSPYCCDALYPDTVSDDERNVLTFVVESPGSGAYTLTFADPNKISAGTPPGTFPFTV